MQPALRDDRLYRQAELKRRLEEAAAASESSIRPTSVRRVYSLLRKAVEDARTVRAGLDERLSK